MAKGLPKKYIKQYGISKKAWNVYRADQKKRKVNISPRKSKGRGKRKVTRRYTRKRKRRRTRTIPILPIAGLGAGLIAPTSANPSGLINYLQTKNWKAAINVTATNLTGYIPQKGQWNLMEAHALHGLILGLVAHKIVSALGGNRVFSNLPSPLNKLRL